MDRPDETAALVALLRNGARPWQQYPDLVEDAGSARAVLDAEVARPDDQATLFVPDSERLVREARAELEAWQENGIQTLTVLDEDYPDNLRMVYDRPPLVFVAGRLLPRDGRSLAVVGSRRSTDAGVAAAAAIGRHLTDNGFTVVSGLAAGIDTAAHESALERDGRTIAVIGTGLNRVYPPANAQLQRRIASTSAVVSQFWPDTPPSRRNFPLRNAVMSGLTLGTIVVEATYTSGARMQARLALAHGRPVFLTQRLVDTESWAREFATRPGTYVVAEPDEITAAIDRLITDGALTN